MALGALHIVLDSTMAGGVDDELEDVEEEEELLEEQEAAVAAAGRPKQTRRKKSRMVGPVLGARCKRRAP